mmetsp:Transcript_54393/g.119301  ORF Transcript_54393/g.119301 Transcript_54393/m.119301 type:complete len:117 (-) Transcript_54393:111-461(-)
MCSAGVDDDRKDLREPPDTGGSLSPDFPRVWRRLVGELLLVLRREPALSVILRVSDMCSTRQGSEDPGLMQVRAPVEVFSRGCGYPRLNTRLLSSMILGLRVFLGESTVDRATSNR